MLKKFARPKVNFKEVFGACATIAV